MYLWPGNNLVRVKKSTMVKLYKECLQVEGKGLLPHMFLSIACVGSTPETKRLSVKRARVNVDDLSTLNNPLKASKAAANSWASAKDMLLNEPTSSTDNEIATAFIQQSDQLIVGSENQQTEQQGLGDGDGNDHLTRMLNRTCKCITSALVACTQESRLPQISENLDDNMTLTAYLALEGERKMHNILNEASRKAES
ncbi:hypothetical protein ACFX15_011922 [Malus domestica]